jgi:hypothetical protein
MSVRCISQVLEKSVHAGTNLLMLIVLADYSDDDGNSYPSVASLARKCRMQPRNANYILKSLQESGELRILKNEGPKGCNRYRIMLAALGVRPLQPIAPLQRNAPLQSSAQEGAILGKKPLQPIAPEPSLNRQDPSKGKTAFGQQFTKADWIPAEAWNGFVEMRKAIKAPMTSRAMTLIVNKLKSFKEQGLDIESILDQSTSNNWKDVYPVKALAREIASAKPWEGAR